MTRVTPANEARADRFAHRDRYRVVVWERHGSWIARLRRFVTADVDWVEVRSWVECETAALGLGSGCVVIVMRDGGAETVADCVRWIVQLRRQRPDLPLAVIGRVRPAALAWVLREAGAVEVAVGASGIRRVARFVDHDYRRRPPSRRPLVELVVETLPWRSLASPPNTHEPNT